MATIRTVIIMIFIKLARLFLFTLLIIGHAMVILSTPNKFSFYFIICGFLS